MSASLGEALIKILAETSGFDKGFSSSVNKAVSGAHKSFNSLGGTVNKTIAGIGGAVAGVGTLIAGMGLRGGMRRALAVEDANLLMRQLGMSTKDIDTILQGVDATFDGTPFANPDGFNFSSQLAVSGRALEDIETDLQSVSNVTAMTLSKDFGQVNGIFLQMAAQGKATTGELQRIEEAGFPIRTVLADALGVGVDGLQKMVSSGELSYDQMMELLGGVEMLDGAAKNLGDSTKIAFGQVFTQLSVLGEKVIAPLLPLARDLFQGMRQGLIDIRPFVVGLAESFSAWATDALPRAQEAVGRVMSAIQGLADLVIGGNFTGALREAFGWEEDSGIVDMILLIRDGIIGLSELLVGGNFTAELREAFGWEEDSAMVDFLLQVRDILPEVAGAIGMAVPVVLGIASAVSLVTKAWQLLTLATPIGIVLALVAAIIYAYQNFEPFRNAVHTAFGAIREVAGPAIQALMEGFQILMPVLQDIAMAVLPYLAQAWDIVSDGVTRVIAALGPLIAAISSMLMPILQALVDVIGPILVPALKFLADILLGAVKGAFDGIVMVITGLTDVFNGIVSLVKNVFAGEWRAAWESVKQIFMGVITAIGGAILTWLNVSVLGIFRTGLLKLGTLWKGGIDALKAAPKAVLEWVKSFFQTSLNAVGSTASSILTRVGQTFSNIFNAIRNTVSNAIKVAQSAFGGAMSAIRGIADDILSAVRNRFDTVMKNIKDFVKNGIDNARTTFSNGMDRIRTAVSDGVERVLGMFRDLPSKILSALGNLGTYLTSSGRSLLSGFIAGIREGFDNAVGAVKSGLGRVRDFFPFSPAREGPFSGRGYVTYSGRALTEDFARALEDGQPRLRRAMSHLMPGAPLVDPGSILPSAAFARSPERSGRGATGDTHNHIDVRIDVSDLRGLQALEDFLKMVDVRTTMVRGVET